MLLKPFFTCFFSLCVVSFAHLISLTPFPFNLGLSLSLSLSFTPFTPPSSQRNAYTHTCTQIYTGIYTHGGAQSSFPVTPFTDFLDTFGTYVPSLAIAFLGHRVANTVSSHISGRLASWISFFVRTSNGGNEDGLGVRSYLRVDSKA